MLAVVLIAYFSEEAEGQLSGEVRSGFVRRMIFGERKNQICIVSINKI
ncbi:hypothetical protein [Aliamphritea spongicola]|nr:hypothetical protein [Aliamphritea spongicola]